MSLLTCENVCMSYENRQVLKNVSFDIEKGDYLSIVGENGSGKTTLMKGILGLMQPSSGTIKRKGITGNKTGYLPQQTIVQKDFPASVYEVVLSGTVGRTKRFFYNSYDKKVAFENMKKLGIENLKMCSYRELSGGQQQRVLLARALCAATEMLVLDEPTAGLDPVATSDLYDILKYLNKNDCITVVMVSHDIKSAIENSNKVLHLGSENLFFGTTEDYLKTDIFTRMMGGR